MKRLMVRVLVMLFTLTSGLVSAKLWIAYHPPISQTNKVEVIKTSDPMPASESITFSGGLAMSAFQSYWDSSDGVSLRFGCFERESPAKAAKNLRDEINGQRVIEHMLILDDKGHRNGERAVIGGETEAEIVWTASTSYYLIRSPSLKHALLFEQSHLWASVPCVNVEELRRESFSRAQPNKSFEMTPR